MRWDWLEKKYQPGRWVSYISGVGKGKITGFLTSMTDPVIYLLEDL